LPPQRFQSSFFGTLTTRRGGDGSTGDLMLRVTTPTASASVSLNPSSKGASCSTRVWTDGGPPARRPPIFPLAPRYFSTEVARSLLTGVAAHAVGRLPSLASGAVAVLLGHLAHAGGWPVPESGSARIADALAADIVACGGTFHTSHHVTRLEELPRAKAVLLDVSPKAFAEIAADRLPVRYRRGLARFRYGPAGRRRSTSSSPSRSPGPIPP
jgi:phytoene dehydrogenase-like protein